MKSIRLVLVASVIFVSTAVCGIFGSSISRCLEDADPDSQELCFDRETQTAAEADRILSLTLTQSVLNITYPATSTLQHATETPSPVVPTATWTLSPTLETVFQSGTYEVEVSTGGRQYHSTWTLEVLNGVITGNAGWDCCPGPRVDPLSGAYVGEEVTIVRDCSGQGWEGPCTQTYTGRIKGNMISGTITGTAIPPSGATWTLFLSP